MKRKILLIASAIIFVIVLIYLITNLGTRPISDDMTCERTSGHCAETCQTGEVVGQAYSCDNQNNICCIPISG